MCNKIKSIFAIITFIACNNVYAQNFGNSPYSKFGIGDISNTVFIRNIAMGNTGTSQSHPNFINNMNPALLSRNKLTIFEASLVGQFKLIKNTDQSQKVGWANINYMAFVFPISGKWASGVGLLPYSTVNYNSSFTDNVINDTLDVTYIYKGSGGINQLFWSNGIEIFKGFSVGIKISYLFGFITNESISQLIVDGKPNKYKLSYNTRTSFSDFILKSGIAYQKKIFDKIYFNFGAAYDFGSKISISKYNAKRFTTIQRWGWDSGYDFLVTDTIQNNIKGKIKLPDGYQFGIGVTKPNHWSVAADFSNNNWSAYRDFNDSTQTFQNSFIFSFGGELTPDIQSVNNFLKRITYRAGFSYSKTPIKLNNQQIYDIGINFGVSLPVGKRKSNISLALILGQKGTASNELIKEQYFRAYAGVSINDKWFVRRKVD